MTAFTSKNRCLHFTDTQATTYVPVKTSIGIKTQTKTASFQWKETAAHIQAHIWETQPWARAPFFPSSLFSGWWMAMANQLSARLFNLTASPAQHKRPMLWTLLLCSEPVFVEEKKKKCMCVYPHVKDGAKPVHHTYGFSNTPRFEPYSVSQTVCVLVCVCALCTYVNCCIPAKQTCCMSVCVFDKS